MSPFRIHGPRLALVVFSTFALGALSTWLLLEPPAPGEIVYALGLVFFLLAFAGYAIWRLAVASRSPGELSLGRAALVLLLLLGGVAIVIPAQEWLQAFLPRWAAVGVPVLCWWVLVYAVAGRFAFRKGGNRAQIGSDAV